MHHSPQNKKTIMIGDHATATNLAVKDLAVAKSFYEGKLGLKLIDAHARKRGGKNLVEVILGQLCDRLAVARQHSLKGLDAR